MAVGVTQYPDDIDDAFDDVTLGWEELDVLDDAGDDPKDVVHGVEELSERVLEASDDNTCELDAKDKDVEDEDRSEELLADESVREIQRYRLGSPTRTEYLRRHRG
ncbi:uncharacterized protein LY89DRAFT_738931 [Mollisia scopiformis]|uniref:Uncharacterized protein n=1 Tax=Mollisia scopiformis TaxID=149040 RepID=A0A194WU58_MOLSC|nr:uncharacterized protein LY89DRAFT_738931 [Mollisia scopiformis]KUJ11496.1 hypothetical protein LY89DRAFT_738931 [Mollisia scopiformis]